jgi:nicotinamide-nucleotide amidase
LIDPDGEACGFYLYHERIPVIFLPGVPKEVRLLAEAKVLPLLLQVGEKQEVVRQRVFKFFGPQEAQIAKTLEGVRGEEKDVLIGFYPNFPENHVTVTARASTPAQAEETLARIELEVERRLGRYLVAKDNDTLEDSIGRRLRTRGLKVAAAESCTGGLISHRLTSVSGSSDYFDRGIVAYSNEAKHEVLGVSSETIKVRGAVSGETASQMAVGVRKISGADIGIASTGIAGPTGGTEEKPVGTVYIALSAADYVGVRRYNFMGRRDQITLLTAQTALNWLHRYLIDDTFIFRY